MTSPASAPGSGVAQMSDRARRDRALAIRAWAVQRGIQLRWTGRIPPWTVELWEAEQVREEGP